MRNIVLRFIPPIITGLGLAIMEVTAQARYDYFPTPWFISIIATVISPWFVGMLITAIGVYLFTMVDLNIDFLTFIAYVINVFAWEDIWYWLIRWHVPYNWVFYICGFGIPYLVYYGIPINTTVGLVISYVILATEKSQYIIL
jgi:hypothetical protein